MNRALLVATLLALFGAPVSAQEVERIRLSGEYVPLGQQHLWVGQLDAALIRHGGFAFGATLRKEGAHATDGWGIGIHGLHRRGVWLAEAGVRWSIPPVEQFRFRSQERNGILVWQWWDYPVQDSALSISIFGRRAAPVGSVGVFAVRDLRRCTLQVGIRTTVMRFGEQTVHREGTGLVVGVDRRYWRLFPAPTIVLSF